MGLDFYICFYHDKRTYRSAHQAYTEVKKLVKRDADSREGIETYRVFFCDLTGGYHHTSISQSEMDRRRAARDGGMGKKGHSKFEGQVRRWQKNPTRSPKRASNPKRRPNG